MKTAISIPDDLFDAVEAASKRLGLSRSQLFARAVKAYLEEHGDEGVTGKLDEVYATVRSHLIPMLARMQSASLAREDW